MIEPPPDLRRYGAAYFAPKPAHVHGETRSNAAASEVTVMSPEVMTPTRFAPDVETTEPRGSPH